MTAPLMESTQFRIICGNPVFPSGMAEVVVKVALPKFTVLALPMDRALGLNDAGDVVGIVRRCGQAAVAWLDGQLVTIAETTRYWCQIAPTDYFCCDINAGRTAVVRVFARIPCRSRASLSSRRRACRGGRPPHPLATWR